jgi:hypothetical protein
MHGARPVILAACAAACALLALAPGASVASTRPGGLAALLSSRELWATIDVCNPADQPDTVGVRGSMPGDGHARDRMYMSFKLQYQSPTTKRWTDLAGASSGLLAVGNAADARQSGRSFQLAAPRSAVTLRGVIEYQWRRGSAVMESASRTTGGGHRSIAGADPAGYSAASCQLG